MAKEKSLFDAARPAIFILNLLFGFNLGNEKKKKQPGRCLKKIIKIFMKIQYLYFLVEFYSDFKFPFTYEPNSLLIVIKFALALTSVVIHWFCFDEEEAEELFQRMKQLPLDKMSEEKMKRHLFVYKIYAGYFILVLLFLILLIILDPNYPIVEHVQFSWVFILKTTLPVPVLVCFLPCLVCSYCSSRVQELALRLNQTRSPLRRSRMMSGMLKEYYRIHSLATLTNRLTSRAMSFLRMAFVLMMVVTVLFHSINFVDTYDDYFEDICLDNFTDMRHLSIDLINIVAGCGIVNFFPLIQYLLVAPPANQMFSVLSKSFAQSFLWKDEWHLRDTVINEDTRPHLLKMRLNQLTHIVHIAFDEPPFTVMGEAVADDALISLFLEVTDLHSNLSVLGSGDFMTITRVQHFIFRTKLYKIIRERKKLFLKL